MSNSNSKVVGKESMEKLMAIIKDEVKNNGGNTGSDSSSNITQLLSDSFYTKSEAYAIMRGDTLPDYDSSISPTDKEIFTGNIIGTKKKFKVDDENGINKGEFVQLTSNTSDDPIKNYNGPFIGNVRKFRIDDTHFIFITATKIHSNDVPTYNVYLIDTSLKNKEVDSYTISNTCFPTTSGYGPISAIYKNEKLYVMAYNKIYVFKPSIIDNDLNLYKELSFTAKMYCQFIIDLLDDGMIGIGSYDYYSGSSSSGYLYVDIYNYDTETDELSDAVMNISKIDTLPQLSDHHFMFSEFITIGKFLYIYITNPYISAYGYFRSYYIDIDNKNITRSGNGYIPTNDSSYFYDISTHLEFIDDNIIFFTENLSKNQGVNGTTFLRCAKLDDGNISIIGSIDLGGGVSGISISKLPRNRMIVSYTVFSSVSSSGTSGSTVYTYEKEYRLDLYEINVNSGTLELLDRNVFSSTSGQYKTNTTSSIGLVYDAAYFINDDINNKYSLIISSTSKQESYCVEFSISEMDRISVNNTIRRAVNNIYGVAAEDGVNGQYIDVITA